MSNSIEILNLEISLFSNRPLVFEMHLLEYIPKSNSEILMGRQEGNSFIDEEDSFCDIPPPDFCDDM